MRLFLILIIFLFSYVPNVWSQEYLWPTDSGQYLSSTFGETRSAHFHAGLDIKTWGREGYRVFASRDGILYRLLVTERGYGKAIYLKHADNTYTVYAHLQRFNDEFQEIADSIRLKDFSFEMDAQLDSLGIFIEQGDIIGFTGSSGIGPPHLHFEVRDSLDNPINALTTNLAVKDDLSPIFSSLIVEPLTEDSRVKGKPVSQYIRSQNNNGDYDFGEIDISGEVGLAVNVYDRANEVHNAYAVHSLTLLHDSDTLFYQELNSFNFSDDREMFLDRIAPFGSDRRGHQRLYGKEGHNNPFYLIDKPQAQILPADTAKNYTIVASDYFGNRSTATLRISPSTKENTASPVTYLPIENWYWHEDWASPDLIHTIDLNEDLKGLKWTDSQIIVQKDESPDIQFSRLNPEQAQKIYTPGRKLSLRFRKNAFFDTLTIATSYSLMNEEIHISIQPEMLATKSDFHVAFYLGEMFQKENKYRLFRKKRSNGELSYIESELRGKTVHAYPSELGEFIIIPDNEAPSISNLKIYQTEYGKWLATVDVKDELSGINSASAVFTINGMRGIAEYDYEEELLIYYHPDFTPNSINTVLIDVEDKAGNNVSFSQEQTITGF
ncbi:MAG TPA: M23 family metallopeptidase [Gracilimonas sp.]|uniref:M23 family metallopeptidase n=1 Tax=Gracilimonas sp. TaxID=1974203 RepID=UPI002DAECD57|nr:M23 family metallopeptidase [Gracilimonas sp.]